MADREKVIKGIECCIEDIACPDDCPYLTDDNEECPGSPLMLMRDALELLKEQNGKDNDVPAKWISVKDRLPEKEGHYLCWACINNIQYLYQICLWKENRWYWVHDVRWWMPLPEPPKEEA